MIETPSRPPRREFLRRAGCAAVAAAAAASRGGVAAGLVPFAPAATTRDLLARAPRARFWVATGPGTTVGCRLCARACTIADGERGMCRARLNHGGELRSLVYGRPITVHVDPIEKKPFYHFLPGSAAYSLATSGCPLRCTFCQNWQISQASPEDYDSPLVSPARIAASAAAKGAPVVAFTYNEPTVFAEYLLDIARAARDAGRRCVLVSCGFMQEAPLAEMCAALDAIKIDLKGFSEEFYRDVSLAELKPVLRSIRQVAKSGTHLEIVNLVVPTLNDDPARLSELAKWVAGEAGPDVPLHFTRFHPDYQLPNLPPTPVATLDRAYDLARAAGLRYVYVGNVPGHRANNTYCAACGAPLIERDGFFVTADRLENGRCPKCRAAVPGVWS